jgi:hypothetical protein
MSQGRVANGEAKVSKYATDSDRGSEIDRNITA